MVNIRQNIKEGITVFKKVKGNLDDILVDNLKKGDKNKIQKFHIALDAVKILGKDEAKVSHKKFKDYLNRFSVAHKYSYSMQCMNYYMEGKTRNPFKIVNKVGLGMSENDLKNIALTGYRSQILSSMDCLVLNNNNQFFYFNKGSFAKDVDRMNIELARKIQMNLKKSKDVIIKNAYHTMEIPKISILKYNPFEDDFYYAAGDGNYLFGRVDDIHKGIFGRYEYMDTKYVLYDEYNWDENPHTYFFKTGGSQYSLIIETSAFKKWEEKGLAAKFLSFFVFKSKVNLYL